MSAKNEQRLMNNNHKNNNKNNKNQGKYNYDNRMNGKVKAKQ